MEPMMLLAALMFALPAAGFVVLLKRLTASDRTSHPLPLEDWEGIFSPSRYRAMERLLDDSDRDFLHGQPGASRLVEKKFRKERVTLFRAYMHQLSDDFHRICKALKLLMVHAQVERHDLAGLILKQQFQFTVTMMTTEVRLVLYSWGWAGVSAQALLEPLTAVRTQLQSLAAIADPSLSAASA
jgi:hypothetical protein